MIRIITITREFGSGGRTVARETAEKLGWDYYDYNLISKIASESGYAESFIEQFGEESEGGWFSGMTANAFSLSDNLFLAQRKVILELAEKGNCVIVGRCADYILEERDDVFNAFVCADEQWKKNRIQNIYRQREEAVDKAFRQKNKRRAAYYKYYTGQNWGQAWNYDLCLKTSSLGIEESADLLARTVLELNERED